VQAPKTRSAPRTPAERRTFLYVLGFGGSGIVMLGAVLAFVAFAGGGGDGGNGAESTSVTYSKDCVEQSYPGLSAKHLTSPDGKVKYNSDPPSSGPHYQSPAPWGIYEEPIKQTILVHNLEHGGIVIQYGDVGSGTVDKLSSFYEGDPYGLVVAPNPKLGKKFALTAWNQPEYPSTQEDLSEVDPGNGFVLTCSRFDEKSFAKFRDERRNKSGERFASVQDMSPGT